MTTLRCEYAIEPNNIDRTNPRFCWVLESTGRGKRQTAYRVMVSSSEENLAQDIGDQWDSGRIESPQMSQVAYRGKELESNSQYFWKVLVWDQDGQMTASEPTQFETAMLKPSEWSARWIGAGPEKEPRPPAGFHQGKKEEAGLADAVQHDGRSILLRRQFQCKGEVKRARVFVTGMGYYELHLNGKKVGKNVLAPAKTNYRKQVLYDTYDVTKTLLAQGDNAVGIHLGNGWFNPYKKWWREYRMQWFGAKRAILQMVVEYADGTSDVVRTDGSWKQAAGPVLFNCVYDGEVYDANHEQEGWATPGFDDSKWQPVNVVEPPGGKLISHRMPAIRITEEKKPVEVDQPDAGKQVFDMGQNFSGWVRISVRGKKGTKVVLRFAEDSRKNGQIDTTSNEHAKATASYTLKGDGVETYEPRFSFFGFRYVEVSGEPALPSIKNLQGCVVQSDCATTGSFECGNELVNKIHRATVWSQRSNMMGYPLDCPQRDERLGWLGDAQVTAEEVMFNMNVPLFLENWLSGIATNQNAATGDIPIISPRPYIQDEGVEWSSTYIVMLWHHYLHYGDRQILAEHYPTMKRYLQYLDSKATNHIIKKGWIGDWGSLVEGWKEGDPPSVPTAFYFYDALLLNRIATVLGKSSDADHFAALSDRIKQAYNEAFFDAQTKNYNDGSQMANAFPLVLGIVPEPFRQAVTEHLVDDILQQHDGHLTTGVLGTKYMIDALVQEGRADVAFQLATQTGFPSWAQMVAKHTTLCEFWSLKQSHNHVMMGSIDAFFYKTLAGIRVDPNHPGFRKIVIRPFVPDSLPFARATIETVHGTVSSGWENSDQEFRLKVRIPVNSTADVYIPTKDASRVMEGKNAAADSEGVKYLRTEGEASVFAVGSGEYEFASQNREGEAPAEP